MDLYQILEVTRTSNASEIKKSYYKLARSWHPDKHIEPQKKKEAEAKFKTITEAYEILSDPEQRKVYDREGMKGLKRHQRGGGGHPFPPFSFFEQAFPGAQFFRRPHGGPRKKVARQTLEVPLKSFYQGETLTFTRNMMVPCEVCRLFDKSQTCGQCQGQGMCIQIQRPAPGINFQTTVPCPKCRGQGTILPDPLPKCAQNCQRGLVSRPREIEFTLKPGSDYGLYVIPKQGDYIRAPHHRADLELELKPPSEGEAYQRQGSPDLIREETITLGEALLGFDYHIEHVDGIRRVRLHSTQVIRPGTVKRIPDQGMLKKDATYGDLYVIFDVKFPEQVNEETRRVLTQIMNRRQNVTPPPKKHPERLLVIDLDQMTDKPPPPQTSSRSPRPPRPPNVQCAQQ